MKEWIHPEIGRVVLQKNSRSKRLVLRVNSADQVRVTLPKLYPYWMAKKMVIKQLEWIKKQQKKQLTKADTQKINWDTTFAIRAKSIQLVASTATEISLNTLPASYEICIPSGTDIKDTNLQSHLKKIVVEVLRVEAKRYIPNRTTQVAQLKGIDINQIRIKNMTSRWGSCSSKKNLNFSLFLMLLPDPLIDYVIYHELAHIKHQNHSADFWQHLEALLPGAKQLDKMMKGQQMPFR